MIRDVGSVALEVGVRALLAPSVLAMRWLWPSRGFVGELDGVPSVRRTPLVAAKIVLDELFFVTEVLSARFVTGADRARLQAEIADGVAFFERAGWLDDPAAYFPAPPPLEPRAFADTSSFGRAYRHLEFASGYEPLPGEPGGERWHARTANRTGHVWILQHPEPRPWLVCLHGYRTGSPLTGFFQFSPRWLHETLGVNLALPVLPLHGPRSSGWRSGDGMFSGEILDMVHLQAQAIWDLRRLIAWLRARDGMPVGLYGLSLGGGIAALTAALEPELACVIAGMPMVDIMGLVQRHVPVFVQDLAERLGISFEQIGRLLRVVSPLALAPRVPAERLFIFGAAADRLVPSHQVSALWQHWGRPRIEWHGGSHTSFGIESAVNLLVSEALLMTRLSAA